MNVWMDVMRGIEPVIQDYERLFDAWGEGGVDGIVIGPMTFEERVATFDPDPGVYRKLGFDPPQPPALQPPGHEQQPSSTWTAESSFPPWKFECVWWRNGKVVARTAAP